VGLTRSGLYHSSHSFVYCMSSPEPRTTHGPSCGLGFIFFRRYALPLFTPTFIGPDIPWLGICPRLVHFSRHSKYHVCIFICCNTLHFSSGQSPHEARLRRSPMISKIPIQGISGMANPLWGRLFGRKFVSTSNGSTSSILTGAQPRYK
jgi:hypothetical protein